MRNIYSVPVSLLEPLRARRRRKQTIRDPQGETVTNA
jgi:hypothetical protein